MSTRKQRNEGGRQRGFADLNKSYGNTGLMESETLYIALLAVRAGAFDTARDALEAHYGSLRVAEQSLKSLDDNAVARYTDLWAVFE